MKCCLSQSVKKMSLFYVAIGSTETKKVTEEGIIISVLVCGVTIFTSHRENCRIPHYTKFFGVAMVDRSVFLISIHCLLWQHVSKLIGLLLDEEFVPLCLI